MATHPWNQIKVLLADALEREPDERAAFLDQSCGDDAALRAEVQTLLDAYQQACAEEVLEAPLFGRAAFSEPAPASPSRVGSYRLVRELGHGGMGTVYLAERADGQFERQVAVKFVRQGMGSSDLRRRFRSERQILASLKHPNIARLHDGGVTEDGLPYLVMEYVEGHPIDAYCDTHHLSTHERLDLFLSVCEAVAYAHRNLVVHRDLKPSNILVTEEGTVKLLDFGIAKLLDEDVLPETMPLTQTGMRLLTPEYAAPEQVRGEPVTTATDVYALGVILYELLTGHRPYQVRGLTPSEVERMVCEVDPEKPSTAVNRIQEMSKGEEDTQQITPEAVSRARATEPERLRRQLAGDLDTIVLTALRKEPARRYASVELLSEDIRRHLEGRPVAARPDTVGYRMSKFVQRHRVEVTTAVAVVLLVATLVGFYTVRLAGERDRAQAEAAKAAQINTFLQEMLGSASPFSGSREMTVTDVLNQAGERLETDLADQPEVQAALHNVIGMTYHSLGAYDAAETHLRTALDIHRTLYGDTRIETGQSLFALGSFLQWNGDHDRAEPLLREALAITRRLSGNESVETGAILNELGLLMNRKGDVAAAESFFGEALPIYRKQLGEVHGNVAGVLNNLGVLKSFQGDLDGAAALYRKAIDIMRQLPGPSHQVNLATNLQNLGAFHKDQGAYDEAEPLLREALDLRRRLLGERHPYIPYTQTHLGDLFYRRGEYDQAEKEVREALEIWLETLSEGHVDLARAYVVLGAILTAKGKPVEGEPHLREALAIRKNNLAEGHMLISQVESVLGACLAAQQRFVEAEPLLVESYAFIEHEYGTQATQTQRALQRLVDLYDAWGKPGKAAPYRALLSK